MSTFGLASEGSAQILWGPGSNELARNWREAVENRTAIPLDGGRCHLDDATFAMCKGKSNVARYLHVYKECWKC